MRTKEKIVKSLSRISFLREYYTGLATIFTLHRVHPFEEGKLSVNENMKITPEFLENIILELKSKDYSFINLDRLHDILEKNENTEKQIVFTFDDGYKDNYDLAYPILKKYNIPFTIYITTSFPENTAVLWWYVIEDLIMENDEILLSNNEKYTCQTQEQKVDTFLNIRKKIISLDPEILLERLESLLTNYEINWIKKCNELALSWSQIEELSRDNLVTIAGHTMNHYPLNRLSESKIRIEIEQANKLIETKIGKLVNHIAYSFGGRSEINQREINVVKGLGLKTAVTTRNGNIYPEHKNFLESLPRIMLTEGFKVEDIGRIRRMRIATL